MKKSYIILLVVILVLGGYLVFKNTQNPAETEIDSKVGENESIVYTSEVFTFEKEGKQFTVQYNGDGSWVRVTFNGTQYELPSVISASGAKYANEEESVIFWEHQREAILEIDGNVVFEGAKLIENKNSTITSTGFSLEGTKWQWKETKYEDGKTVNPNKPEEFVMYFMEEGRFSSKTDCNTVMGTYAVEEDRLSFGQMASTIMACPDEQTQEEVYTAMLVDAKTVKVNEAGDQMELGIEGAEKGTITFTRSLE